MGINYPYVYTPIEKFIPLEPQHTGAIKMATKVTDMSLRKLEGIKGETQKISIGSGIQLWVTVNQAGLTAKIWYLRYYDASGKRQIAKIGEYPALSLAKVVGVAEDMKSKAKEGVNLAQENAKQKRIIVEGNTQEQRTFQSVANAWLDKKMPEWDGAHGKRQRERLVGNIFPVFGQLPLNAVTMEEVDNALKIVIERGAKESAQRICTIIKSIFEYADTMGYLENPIIINRLTRYRKDMPQPDRKQHLYREMNEDEIGTLMLNLEHYKHRGTLQTSTALRLAPYVMLRPIEICEAEWEEINLEAAEWYIPAAKMKMERDHIVPLPIQAIAILLEARQISKNNRFVFPSPRKNDAPITTGSLLQALRRMGYASNRQEGDQFCTHGFRGMASTTLNQHLNFQYLKQDWIEFQLAHAEENKVRAAYNALTPRSYLDERKKMVQAYADYLDELKDKAKSRQENPKIE